MYFLCSPYSLIHLFYSIFLKDSSVTWTNSKKMSAALHHFLLIHSHLYPILLNNFIMFWGIIIRPRRFLPVFLLYKAKDWIGSGQGAGMWKSIKKLISSSIQFERCNWKMGTCKTATHTHLFTRMAKDEEWCREPGKKATVREMTYNNELKSFTIFFSL